MPNENSPAPLTLFVDTQVLIYTFEKCEPAWVQFIESRLSSGYRLVLSEEILYEFGQSGTLDAALNLTRRVVEHEPLWIRSFADLEADEVCCFARAKQAILTDPVTVFVEDFAKVSQMTVKRQLSPDDFVRSAFDQRTKEGLSELARGHAKVLNELSKAVGLGQMTKELKQQALRAGLRAFLSRGSDLTTPFFGSELDAAVKHCFKHHKMLLHECHAYATEGHLADYRTSSSKRVARNSDSRDLMLATAAFPYVSAFVTNDGYLYDSLSYVKRHLPHISTELIRKPF